MARSNGGDGKQKRRSLAGRAKDENDPEWKRWFLEVERRRKALQKPRLRIVRFDKDGQTTQVVRPVSEPVAVKKVLHGLLPAQPVQGGELFLIQDLWARIVPGEIAGECEVFSFKKGVLTIHVRSNVLLQEIRQFHYDALVQDLRSHWSVPTPLVKAVFTIGKK